MNTEAPRSESTIEGVTISDRLIRTSSDTYLLPEIKSVHVIQEAYFLSVWLYLLGGVFLIYWLPMAGSFLICVSLFHLIFSRWTAVRIVTTTGKKNIATYWAFRFSNTKVSEAQQKASAVMNAIAERI